MSTRASGFSSVAGLIWPEELRAGEINHALVFAYPFTRSGGPVGLATLAVAVGEQPDTVEEVCEPFLVRAGLLARTPRGRVATPGAWRHLGRKPPDRMGAGMPPLPGLFDQSP